MYFTTIMLDNVNKNIKENKSVCNKLGTYKLIMMYINILFFKLFPIFVLEVKYI